MLQRFQKEKEAMRNAQATEQPPTNTDLAAGSKQESFSLPPVAADNAFNLCVNVSDVELLLQADHAVQTLNCLDLDLDNLLEESPSGSPIQEGDSQSVYVIPGLPEGLPSPLEKKIKQLAEAVKIVEGEGKQKTFQADINNILMQIETQAKELNVQLRTAVFAHLASFLPCANNTLTKMLKKIHLNEQVCCLFSGF
uniref:Ubinuclein middle domain-containing protein n=2 Tax=Eptatretus burgeri TaxID=7764 RepID=A0A8C4QKT4_EPTBU